MLWGTTTLGATVEAAAWAAGPMAGSSDDNFCDGVLTGHFAKWQRGAHPGTERVLRGLVYVLGVAEHLPGCDDTVNPLHRLYHDDLRRELNRDAARRVCSQQPNYPGGNMDCDEYPFASTYQGGAQSVYEQDARIGNFSARPIDSTDNQMAGNWISIFYAENRILDYRGGQFGDMRDPFITRIVP
ncbi:NucA/NucB deoxyribonuclease domain-containing protein [Allonocardiopsis opalescens]|uniref:NucA/NucB deoxyribonuclease domain-containing protein n=1 Tax=Allonocardiopsis opalescens TaxID=1144618 RepID=UPI001B801388|nr:NucA/NucB deoxyribonuclease domain-containing protein [Allonocardiopsis opalescens]